MPTQLLESPAVPAWTAGTVQLPSAPVKSAPLPESTYPDQFSEPTTPSRSHWRVPTARSRGVVWGQAAGTGLPALRGRARRARAGADDPEAPGANAGRRGTEAMCTLPVAGATELRPALTGPVLHRPAASTSTPATLALLSKALVARRWDEVELGVPIDLMFLCTFRVGPAKPG
jgi:hypothetical protein